MSFYSYFRCFFAITMEYICKNCKFFREENGKEYCWITEKTVSAETPICTFNFKPKKEEK